MRRTLLVASLLASGVFLAALAACSLAAPVLRPQGARTIGGPATVPAGSAMGLSSAGWPAVAQPTTDSRAAGVAAANPLVGFRTSYQTVTVPPSWAAPYTNVSNGVKTDQKVVALTIDDGPTADTRHLVNELSLLDDHATFFWVGSRITTEIADYSLQHGEELANHTWNHPNMWKLTSDEASAEIGLTSARIASVAGRTPLWFRSPYNRLYPVDLAEIRAHGLRYANYDVTTLDWVSGIALSKVLYHFSKTLRPGGIILMHDSPGKPNRFLLPVLLYLKLNGYRVVTLSQLAQMGPPIDEPFTLGVKGLAW
jgi:peptidoglycan/xylan/chitin deacetylase (PgdA/CDA1 family)